MSRRKKKPANEEVELNLAAMLDMAFQLLTFFILTFNPPPVEGQISLRLPPPKPVDAKVAGAKPPGADQNSKDAVKSVSTLVISAFADQGGQLGSMGVGEEGVATLPALDEKLKKIFNDPSVPFEQVIIQVGSALKYEELMKVVEVCAKQKMPDGKPLSKLSFVEAGGPEK